jgi:phage replication O-like protein O
MGTDNPKSEPALFKSKKVAISPVATALDIAFLRLSLNALKRALKVGLSGPEWECFLAIYWWTAGFRRKECKAGYSALRHLTGRSKNAIALALASLQEKNMIMQTQKPGWRTPAHYCISEYPIGDSTENGTVPQTAPGSPSSGTGEFPNQDCGESPKRDTRKKDLLERKNVKKEVEKETETAKSTSSSASSFSSNTEKAALSKPSFEILFGIFDEIRSQHPEKFTPLGADARNKHNQVIAKSLWDELLAIHSNERGAESYFREVINHAAQCINRDYLPCRFDFIAKDLHRCNLIHIGSFDKPYGWKNKKANVITRSGRGDISEWTGREDTPEELKKRRRMWQKVAEDQRERLAQMRAAERKA